jgi:hypothetical protein
MLADFRKGCAGNIAILVSDEQTILLQKKGPKGDYGDLTSSHGSEFIPSDVTNPRVRKVA